MAAFRLPGSSARRVAEQPSGVASLRAERGDRDRRLRQREHERADAHEQARDERDLQARIAHAAIAAVEPHEHRPHDGAGDGEPSSARASAAPSARISRARRAATCVRLSLTLHQNPRWRWIRRETLRRIAWPALGAAHRFRVGSHLDPRSQRATMRVIQSAACGVLLAVVLSLAGCGSSDSAGSIPTITFKSAAMSGAEIPVRYTCDGSDTTPPLEWAKCRRNRDAGAVRRRRDTYDEVICAVRRMGRCGHRSGAAHGGSGPAARGGVRR